MLADELRKNSVVNENLNKQNREKYLYEYFKILTSNLIEFSKRNIERRYHLYYSVDVYNQISLEADYLGSLSFNFDEFYKRFMNFCLDNGLKCRIVLEKEDTFDSWSNIFLKRGFKRVEISW